MNEILRAIEAEQMRNDLPNFRIGDTVKLQRKNPNVRRYCY